MSKKVYYVRHGESQANVDGITAGAENDSPLTENGKQQAKKAAQDLKRKGIELVVCSPLKRAHQTAEIIANEIGYDPNKIIENSDFVERYVGIYSDRKYSEYVEAVRSDSLDESAETPEVMQERVQRGLDWLKQQKSQTILLVSHGGTSRILRCIVNGLHHSHMYKLDAFENAQIYEFDLK